MINKVIVILLKRAEKQEKVNSGKIKQHSKISASPKQQHYHY